MKQCLPCHDHTTQQEVVPAAGHPWITHTLQAVAPAAAASACPCSQHLAAAAVHGRSVEPAAASAAAGRTGGHPCAACIAHPCCCYARSVKVAATHAERAGTAVHNGRQEQ